MSIRFCSSNIKFDSLQYLLITYITAIRVYNIEVSICFDNHYNNSEFTKVRKCNKLDIVYTTVSDAKRTNVPETRTGQCEKPR